MEKMTDVCAIEITISCVTRGVEYMVKTIPQIHTARSATAKANIYTRVDDDMRPTYTAITNMLPGMPSTHTRKLAKV